MSSANDNETGFSESDIHFARETFYRDCPNGSCSKRKFLTFIRKSSAHTSLQKSPRTNLLFQTWTSRQNHRRSRKFFSMMFDIYDRNHDGQLDFNEYIYALSALTGANRLRTVETLYNFFDIHHQGYITRQEFNSRKKLAAQFLGQYKTGIQDPLSYDQAFNTMDVNHDGKISKEEFIEWHLQDRRISDETKPRKKRTRLFKNLTHLVDIRGQIKTSTLQQRSQDDHSNKSPIDAWLETTVNVNNNLNFSRLSSSPRSINADRYLLKVLRRARNRFIQHRHSSLRQGYVALNPNPIDTQSDSGMFTTSSKTNVNEDFESNSLLDIDEDSFQSIHSNDPDNDLLCQSLEAALIETLIELRQLRTTNQAIITRL